MRRWERCCSGWRKRGQRSRRRARRASKEREDFSPCSARSAASATSVFTTISFTGTAVGTHRFPVRSETGSRLDAPVGGGIVGIVELELVGIGDGHHVHALVPQVQTVHAGNHFG